MSPLCEHASPDECPNHGTQHRDPPLPPPRIAALLQKLETAARLTERASTGTSHEQQEAASHLQGVRLELRAALAEG